MPLIGTFLTQLLSINERHFGVEIPLDAVDDVSKFLKPNKSLFLGAAEAESVGVDFVIARSADACMYVCTYVHAHAHTYASTPTCMNVLT